MSWGSGKWGSMPWGTCDEPAAPSIQAAVVIADAYVLGEQLLRLDFSEPVKKNDVLLDPASYTVVPAGSGVVVNPTNVYAPIGGKVDYVLLAMTSPTVGEEYVVDVTNIRGANGNTVDAENSASEFTARVTKYDFAQDIQQSMYDKRPSSVMSLVLLAITGEDEKIGGTEGANE